MYRLPISTKYTVYCLLSDPAIDIDLSPKNPEGKWIYLDSLNGNDLVFKTGEQAAEFDIAPLTARHQATLSCLVEQCKTELTTKPEMDGYYSYIINEYIVARGLKSVRNFSVGEEPIKLVFEEGILNQESLDCLGKDVVDELAIHISKVTHSPFLIKDRGKS